MRVKITYTVAGNTQEQEDMLRWPDLSTLEEVMPHVSAYLDNLYGAGNSTIIKVEEV